MALRLRGLLRRLGDSDVAAFHVHSALAEEVTPVGSFEGGSPDDVLVYHCSFGEPGLTAWLTRRRERLVLVYHNITPPEYFTPYNTETASRLAWGREELLMLRDRVVAAVAVSEYNAAELRALGYRDPAVVPVGVDPARLQDDADDGPTVARLDAEVRNPIILSVGQLLPHKRPDLVLEAFHVLRACLGVDAGLVVVGAHRQAMYSSALVHLAHDLALDRLWLAGSMSDAALATVYRRGAPLLAA